MDELSVKYSKVMSNTYKNYLYINLEFLETRKIWSEEMLKLEMFWKVKMHLIEKKDRIKYWWYSIKH